MNITTLYSSSKKKIVKSWTWGLTHVTLLETVNFPSLSSFMWPITWLLLLKWLCFHLFIHSFFEKHSNIKYYKIKWKLSNQSVVEQNKPMEEEELWHKSLRWTHKHIQNSHLNTKLEVRVCMNRTWLIPLLALCTLSL